MKLRCNRFNFIYTVSTILIRAYKTTLCFFLNCTSIRKYKRILTTENLTTIKPSNSRISPKAVLPFPACRRATGPFPPSPPRAVINEITMPFIRKIRRNYFSEVSCRPVAAPGISSWCSFELTLRATVATAKERADNAHVVSCSPILRPRLQRDCLSPVIKLVSTVLMPGHKDGKRTTETKAERASWRYSPGKSRNCIAHVHNWLHRHSNLLLQARVEREGSKFDNKSSPSRWTLILLSKTEE